jgi:hypothetical protein
MITVEKTETKVRIMIPNEAVPEEQLNAPLAWLRLEEIVQRSRLTEQGAERMAEAVKTKWWGEYKEKLIPPSER